MGKKRNNRTKRNGRFLGTYTLPSGEKLIGELKFWPSQFDGQFIL